LVDAREIKQYLIYSLSIFPSYIHFSISQHDDTFGPYTNNNTVECLTLIIYMCVIVSDKGE